MFEEAAGKAIVGGWRLKSWYIEVESGDERPKREYPLGDDAIGHLLYTPDGYFAGFVSRANRPLKTSDAVLGGTDEERAAAAATYLAYCGRYEVRDGAVRHYVESSLHQNWVGTEQVRHAEVDGDTLTIRTPPLPVTQSGVRQVSILEWMRGEGRR